MSKYAQTLALCREALTLIHENLKECVRTTEELNRLNKEAMRELRSRMVPSVEEIIGGSHDRNDT